MRRSRSVVALFCWFVLGALPVWNVEGLEVELSAVATGERPGAPAADFRGRLIFEPSAGPDLEGARVRSVQVVGESRVSIEIPPGSVWLMRPDLEGWWARPRAVSPENGLAVLRLYPAGEVEVDLETVSAAPPPGRLRASFTSSPGGFAPMRSDPPESPGSGDELSGTSDCTAVSREDGKSAWSCRLPAGVGLDVKFHAPGYASVLRWDLTLPHHGKRDLGALELRPGGSVLGWVDVPVAVPDGAVTVALSPVTAGLPTSRLRGLERSAEVGRGGVFQFQDLAPGSYQVEVVAPGWSAVEYGPLKVMAGRETELLQVLELRRPSEVRICASPAVIPGFRLPWDTWEFYLFPPEGDFRTPIHGKAGEDGCWTRAGVPPGDYRLTVRDSRRSLWAEERLAVGEGPFTHAVDMDLIPLGGTVRQAGEVRRAELHFSRRVVGADGHPGEQDVVVITDLQGVIGGALPSEGEWEVFARLRRGGANHFLGRHRITPSEDGEATLHLEIPAGRIVGRVLTSRGEEVERANVLVRSLPHGEAEASKALTGHRGEFSFEALAPGDYAIDVLAAEGTARAEVTLTESGPMEEVEVVLAGVRSLAGRVLGDQGPVPGAEVLVYGLLDEYRPQTVKRATTGTDGAFTTSYPADATRLRILVLPPGYSATTYVVPPPAEDAGPLTLPVDRLGGTAVLTSAGDNLLVSPGTLHVDGHEVWLPLLKGWALMGGGSVGRDTWVIPNLSLGNYRWCPPRSPCEDGFLPPHGSLELRAEAGSRPGRRNPAR